MQKKWYASKTIWVNLLALIGSITVAVFGYVISPEIQASILVVLNIILGAVTKENIVW